MEIAGQFLAAVAAWFQLAEGHARTNARLGEEIQEMRRERHVAPVTHVDARIAIFERVADARGGNGVFQTGDGLKQ